jgi:hypothetical protein
LKHCTLTASIEMSVTDAILTSTATLEKEAHCYLSDASVVYVPEHPHHFPDIRFIFAEYASKLACINAYMRLKNTKVIIGNVETNFETLALKSTSASQELKDVSAAADGGELQEHVNAKKVKPDIGYQGDATQEMINSAIKKLEDGKHPSMVLREYLTQKGGKIDITPEFCVADWGDEEARFECTVYVNGRVLDTRTALTKEARKMAADGALRFLLSEDQATL